MKLSKVLNVNIGFIVKNWADDYIRARYNNDLQEYITKTAIRYVEQTYVEKDFTYFDTLMFLQDAFRKPTLILKKELRTQYNIGQEKWFINELKESIKYYNNN